MQLLVNNFEQYQITQPEDLKRKLLTEVSITVATDRAISSLERNKCCGRTRQVFREPDATVLGLATIPIM